MTDRELAGCAQVRLDDGDVAVLTTDAIAYLNGIGTRSSTRMAAAIMQLRREHAALLIRTPSSEGDGRDGEDARAWRQWCESVGAEQIVALNEKFGGALGLVRDAERYRWLRRHGELYLPGVKDAVNSLYRDDSPGMWDAAIDAAIAAAEGGATRSA